MRLANVDAVLTRPAAAVPGQALDRRQCLGWLAAGLAPGLLACSREPLRGRPVAAGATVLALGDSLTHGTGAAPEASYPSVLAGLTGWQITNAGVPGDTAEQALQRLPSLLEAPAPALVLLCIGGNDLLRRLDESTTRSQIQRMVAMAQAAGAQVLLIAVPRPTLAARFTGQLDDHPMYGELAAALRVPLHRQGWSEVLADERLRADAIHANAQGYAAFARGLLATLRASGLFIG